MAAVMQPPLPVPEATRPQLLAINKSSAGLDEQLDQAAHIIGLPTDWVTLQGSCRIEAAQRLVRARADWVLRWVLDKLRDAADSGPQARMNVKAWALLDCMVHALPVSRCAPHLRDAQFLTIVERTLEENFGADITLEPTGSSYDKHRADASESSETVQEDMPPTRKRKRGSEANAPSKRAAVQGAAPADLFGAVRSIVRSIRDKAASSDTSGELGQGEHMLMVLRTDSAQAARILKCWLYAMQRLTVAAALPAESAYTDLSLAVNIWELRTVDPGSDIETTTEQFSTECLVPVLLLSQTLQLDPTASQNVATILDKLLAKHLLGPSRAAFFENVKSNTGTKERQTHPKAELLSSSIGPLRAKLLQAAQIEDAGDFVPPKLSLLFSAVPQLLDLAIRSSPARTPKSRNAEKPWVQAAFVALAECAGCALAVPDFVTPSRSIDALQNSLHVLASHDMTLNVEILRDLFWFHSGLDFPLRGKRIVHWSLVAALTELNPDIFLMDPGAKASVSHSDNRPDDLAKHLFDHISSKRLTGSSSDTSNQLVNGSEITTHVGQDDLTAEATIQRIIVPIMCAFARNRNLRGFLERWTEQLRIQSRIALSGMGTFVQNIWESDVLISALVNVFETSLTPGVIGEILRGYVKDVEAQAEHSDLEENAHSDDVIVHAILQSIKTDDTIDGLKPQLLSLWDVYSSRVIKKNPDAVAWMILCRLFSHLWSNHLHESASLQERLLRPLVERAAKDATFVPKDGHFSQIKSATRAAALGFFLTACQCLASIPGSDDLFRRDLPKVLKAMSPAQLESHDLLTAVETFCTAHVSLLDTLGPGIGPETQDNREEAISGLLFTISGMDEEARASVAACLSRSVFEEGSTTLQAAFASACLAALSADNESLHSTSVSYLLQATPLSIAREHREAILDTLVATLHLHLGREESLLSLITHLMDAPNATAKISSNGTALFDLAQRVHDAKLESSSALHNLQLLAQATLTHVLLNKNQAQNNRFLEQYKGQIILTMKQSRECFPSKLAILRGSLLASYKDDALISMDQYLELLSTCLQDETAPAVYVLDAFNEIPLQAHRDDAKGFKATRALLQAWITLKLFKHQPLRQFDKISFEAVPVQLWTPLLVAVTRYGLYAETDWLVHVRSALLCKTISAMDKARILSSIKAAFEPLRLKQRLNMMELCLTIRSANDSVADYQILNALISVAEDKYEDDAEVRAQKLDLLPRLCTLLGDSQNDASFNTLLDGITTVILDKHTFTTQHSIESVLAVLTRVASRNSPLLTAEHAPAIFARLCATTRSILLLHRGRIRGRFHLLIPLLQNLLLCLFIPNGNRGSAHPLWINSTSTSSGRLDSRNAAQFTRLLGTLCSPTQSSVQRLHHSSHFKESKTKKELNDPVKAAREYASQFIYPFLSSYCRFQLYGRLEPRVRDKLTAGIWDAVGLASMDRASLDSMFAGLGKSERDVWKGIWREWERTNGRKELSRVD